MLRWVAGADAPRSALLVLAFAMAGAVAIYAPALDSAFVGDDYLLLRASSEMSWPGFLRATWDPGADPGVLVLSANYWRPLSFLTFRLIHEAAGDNPFPYHLVLLLSHLGSVVLIYLLARRLLRSYAGAATAALLFAVHPAAVESIAWIAAVNSMALPFALGSWLTFAVAVENPGVRWRWMAASLLLLAIALAYRETAVVFLAAMALWYLFGPARTRLRDRATWFVFLPHLALVAIHAVVFVGIFSDGGGRPLWEVGSEAPRRLWFYLRQGWALPAYPGSEAEAWWGRMLAVALLAAPFFALWRRQWLPAALGLAFLVALTPYVFFSLGQGPRYFYFPSALLALFAGAIVTVIGPRFSMPGLRVTPWNAGMGLAALLLLVTIPVANGRVREWASNYPGQSESWLAGLLAEHPSPPDDGALWIIDPPFVIALFDGYIAGPMVAVAYGTDVPVRVVNSEFYTFVEGMMEPGDALYWWPVSRTASGY